MENHFKGDSKMETKPTQGRPSTSSLQADWYARCMIAKAIAAAQAKGN